MPPRNSPTPGLASEAPFVDIDLDTPEGTQPPNSPAQGNPPRIELGDDEATRYNEDERTEMRAFLDLLDASSSVLAPIPGTVRRYDRSQFRFVPVTATPSTAEDDGSLDRQIETHGGSFDGSTATGPWGTLHRPRINGNELIVPYMNSTRLADAHSDSVRPERPHMDDSGPSILSTIYTRATSPIAQSSKPSSLASSQGSFENPTFETTTGLPSYRAHILTEGMRRQQSRLDSTASSSSSLSPDSDMDADTEQPGSLHRSL
nr:hypothetical protein B0A51_02004 [Rachicladosporium sp. CCFEE 5018]